MRALRRSARFVFLFGASFLLLPFGLGARALALFGAERAALRASARVQSWWARSLLLGFGVEVALASPLPRGVHLVVANHVSYLDVAVLGTCFPGRFVAKSEIAGWPILGPLARVAGTIFVVQKKRRDILRVRREIERTLAAGVSVVLFAEGGSSRGVTVERLHSALLESAASGGIPCLAAALTYETPRDPWAPAATVCWWGGMQFWPHAWRLAGMGGVRAELVVAERTLHAADRKSLARELHAALLALFRPVRQAPLPPDYPWPELFAPSAGAGERTGA